MKKFISLLIAISLLVFSGCHRQTTIILQPGQTLPSSETGSASSADSSTNTQTETSSPSSIETTAETDAAKSDGKKQNSSTNKKPSSSQSGTSTTKPKETSPAETSAPESSPVETTVPDTTPIETTTPDTSPTETTAPDSSPAETAAPDSSPAETVAPNEPAETLPSVYDISQHHVGSFEKSVLQEINRYRETEEHATLSMKSKLAALAAIRAYECSVSWGHTRPDGRGWSTVLSDYGYGASYIAENILYASAGTDAAALVSAWMSSSSHRDNIMNADFSHTGIGIYYANGYVFVVCIFAG